MKHSYRPECECGRCTKERQRRNAQANDRTIAEVMSDWSISRNRRRARISAEYWDAYEAGRPMSDDDR